MRFKLLVGQHIQNEPDGTEKKYSAGEVIESNVDLEKRFGDKFRRVYGTPEDERDEPTTGDDLERMTVKELQALAAEEEVDLRGMTKKEDLIKALRLGGRTVSKV